MGIGYPEPTIDVALSYKYGTSRVSPKTNLKEGFFYTA